MPWSVLCTLTPASLEKQLPTCVSASRHIECCPPVGVAPFMQQALLQGRHSSSRSSSDVSTGSCYQHAQNTIALAEETATKAFKECRLLQAPPVASNQYWQPAGLNASNKHVSITDARPCNIRVHLQACLAPAPAGDKATSCHAVRPGPPVHAEALRRCPAPGSVPVSKQRQAHKRGRSRRTPITLM